MPYKNFTSSLNNQGNGEIDIQQENAAVEWDIYQISIADPNISPRSGSHLIAAIYYNGLFVCSTSQGAGDAATGPPDIILTRSDTIQIIFTGGISLDPITATVWFHENAAGTTTDVSP